MNVAELSAVVDELNYILGKISKYLKNNQYVYLRAFDSWLDGYNLIAARLNAERTVSVPVFRLSPIDYSPTGKSIKQECVTKFVKTISHQVARLEEKISQLQAAAAEKRSRVQSLERFFHRDADGRPVEPAAADKRAFIAIPAGEAGLKTFWQGVQPALETRGLSFFLADRAQLDDAALCELCQELYSCRLAICDLTGQAANVMLALGLAYGIGKPVIVVQQQDEPPLGAVANNGFIRYAGTAEFKTALGAALPPLLQD